MELLKVEVKVFAVNDGDEFGKPGKYLGGCRGIIYPQCLADAGVCLGSAWQTPGHFA